MTNGNEKIGAVVARMYDALEKIDEGLTEELEGEATLVVEDAVLVCAMKVKDKDGDTIKKLTGIQSSCKDYAAEGLLNRGIRVVA